MTHKAWVFPAALAAMVAATPSQAQAKIEYAAYEGPDVIKTGTGGTKVSKHGIDFWVTGEPPRRYRVIGSVSDRRSEEWDGGHAIGSRTVAKKVKAAGGTAVILVDQKDLGTGGASIGSGTSSFGFLFGFGTSKTTTNFVVVRYLETEAAQPAVADK